MKESKIENRKGKRLKYGTEGNEGEAEGRNTTR